MPYTESNDTATGFMVNDHARWSDFNKEDFKLKSFGSHDIDIAITATSICGSDIHTITAGWGNADLPLCVGHEIVGRAVRVGDAVKSIKVGDRCGVGAQVGADLNCDMCNTDRENYCPNLVDTYGGVYPDKTKSQGGFASHIRAHEYFTFKIPDQLEDSVAAPHLCASLTVYAPLVHLGAGPGKKVAITGLGGLGHMAVQFAAALGCETWVISHSSNKKEDALKLGAKGFIDTSKEDWHKPYAFAFDFIINTADATHKFTIPDYLSTIKVGGHFHICGIGDEPFSINSGMLAGGMWSISSNHIGNRPEMIAMLQLAADKGIKPWVETMEISEENLKTAVERVQKGDVRYRICLTAYDGAFGKRT